ncbi:MAG TPA: histone deacetylase [Candidatus Eisenbacteria bacterium]|jgi:acetoin utilization deacetylase AcuC-like enzyme
MSSAAVVVHSSGYFCDIGPHVFPTEKFARVRALLVSGGEIENGDVHEPEPATSADLLRVHTPEYLDDLAALRWTHRTRMSELPLTAEIVRSYRLAAGGTTLAARGALERGIGVNLGGGFHHASADHAEGFCYLNDLAVAVRAVRHPGGLRRAAVVDLDVHQGNGTALVFEGDESVFTLSIHQELNYPVPKARSTLDVGLEDGTGDEEYLRRLDAALEPVWRFEPEIVLYQAGADPYAEDQLGGLALSMSGLEARDRRVLEGCAARRIPAVVTLGGGYARRVEDTVRIHARTCEIALSLARGQRPA